jgi:hypothetical protein
VTGDRSSKTGARRGARQGVVTFVNDAVAIAPSKWLVTARPTWIVAAIVIDWLPTTVHVLPLLDTDAVNVLPARCSLTQ